MVLCWEGTAAFGHGEVQTGTVVVPSEEEPAGCFSVLLFPFFFLSHSITTRWSPLFVHARRASLASVEGRRWNYVVCCVKPVPKFLRAHSDTATRDNSLVMLARTEGAAHSPESSHRLLKTRAGELIGSRLRDSLAIAETAEIRLTCAG